MLTRIIALDMQSIILPTNVIASKAINNEVNFDNVVNDVSLLKDKY